MIGSGRYRSRFCIARTAEVECLHPVATAHGSVLRALRRLSGSVRSLPPLVVLRALRRMSACVRSLPLAVLYCAPCGG